MFQKTTIRRTSLVSDPQRYNKVNKRNEYLNLHLIHLFITGADCLKNRSYTSTKNSKLFSKNRNSTEYENKNSLNKIGKTSPNPYFFRIRIDYQSETNHGSGYDKTRYKYKNI